MRISSAQREQYRTARTAKTAAIVAAMAAIVANILAIVSICIALSVWVLPQRRRDAA